MRAQLVLAFMAVMVSCTSDSPTGMQEELVGEDPNLVQSMASTTARELAGLASASEAAFSRSASLASSVRVEFEQLQSRALQGDLNTTAADRLIEKVKSSLQKAINSSATLNQDILNNRAEVVNSLNLQTNQSAQLLLKELEVSSDGQATNLKSLAVSYLEGITDYEKRVTEKTDVCCKAKAITVPEVTYTPPSVTCDLSAYTVAQCASNAEVELRKRMQTAITKQAGLKHFVSNCTDLKASIKSQGAALLRAKSDCVNARDKIKSQISDKWNTLKSKYLEERNTSLANYKSYKAEVESQEASRTEQWASAEEIVCLLEGYKLHGTFENVAPNCSLSGLVPASESVTYSKIDAALPLELDRIPGLSETFDACDKDEAADESDRSCVLPHALPLPTCNGTHHVATTRSPTPAPTQEIEDLGCYETTKAAELGWVSTGRASTLSEARRVCAGYNYLSLDCPKLGTSNVHCIPDLASLQAARKIAEGECSGKPHDKAIHNGTNGECDGKYTIAMNGFEMEDGALAGGWDRGEVFKVVSSKQPIEHEGSPVELDEFLDAPQTLLQSQVGDAVHKAKLCETNSSCSFKVESRTMSEETNSGSPKRADKTMIIAYTLHITPSHMHHEGHHSWLLNAVEYKEYLVAVDNFGEEQVLATQFEDPDLEQKQRDLASCIANTRFGVQQNTETGALTEFLVDKAPNTAGSGSLNCTEHETRIQQIYVGSADAVAGTVTKVTTGASASLLEFDAVEHDINGEKRSRYRHQLHPDGRLTVHHKSRTILTQSFMSTPTDPDNDSLEVTSEGSSTVHNGATEGFSQTTNTDFGRDSPDKMISCAKINAEDPLGDSKCEEVPEAFASPQKVRLQSAGNTTAKRIAQPVLIQLDSIPRTQFLHTAKASGRPMVFVQAPELREHLKSSLRRPDHASARRLAADLAGKKQFVKWMQEASHEDLTRAEFVNQLSLLMVPPVAREAVVKEMLAQRITNPSALMVLMEAFGYSLSRSTGATEQLITLASSEQVSTAAREQALVGLVQIRCYDHSNAIRRLSELSHTPLATMALHIQHGLIGHSGHCTDGKSSTGYSDLLQQVRTRLARAVTNRDEHTAMMLIDAVGNSQSQDPAHTQALIDVTTAGHTRRMRLLAVENLGVLWTDGARRHLKELAHSEDKSMQKAVLVALSGKYLHPADLRHPRSKRNMARSVPLHKHSRRTLSSEIRPENALKQANEHNWRDERALAEALAKPTPNATLMGAVQYSGDTTVETDVTMAELARRRAPIYRPEVLRRRARSEYELGRTTDVATYIMDELAAGVFSGFKKIRNGLLEMQSSMEVEDAKAALATANKRLREIEARGYLGENLKVKRTIDAQVEKAKKNLEDAEHREAALGLLAAKRSASQQQADDARKDAETIKGKLVWYKELKYVVRSQLDSWGVMSFDAAALSKELDDATKRADQVSKRLTESLKEQDTLRVSIEEEYDAKKTQAEQEEKLARLGLTLDDAKKQREAAEKPQEVAEIAKILDSIDGADKKLANAKSKRAIAQSSLLDQQEVTTKLVKDAADAAVNVAEGILEDAEKHRDALKSYFDGRKEEGSIQDHQQAGIDSEMWYADHKAAWAKAGLEAAQNKQTTLDSEIAKQTEIRDAQAEVDDAKQKRWAAGMANDQAAKDEAEQAVRAAEKKREGLDTELVALEKTRHAASLHERLEAKQQELDVAAQEVRDVKKRVAAAKGWGGSELEEANAALQAAENKKSGLEMEVDDQESDYNLLKEARKQAGADEDAEDSQKKTGGGDEKEKNSSQTEERQEVKQKIVPKDKAELPTKAGPDPENDDLAEESNEKARATYLHDMEVEDADAALERDRKLLAVKQNSDFTTAAIGYMTNKVIEKVAEEGAQLIGVGQDVIDFVKIAAGAVDGDVLEKGKKVLTSLSALAISTMAGIPEDVVDAVRFVAGNALGFEDFNTGGGDENAEDSQKKVLTVTIDSSSDMGKKIMETTTTPEKSKKMKNAYLEKFAKRQIETITKKDNLKAQFKGEYDKIEKSFLAKKGKGFQVEQVNIDKNGKTEAGKWKAEIKFEKTWPLPEQSDIQALVKVGVKINFDNQEGNTDDHNGKLCGNAYGGVDVKLWSWNFPVLEVGVEKCSGLPLEKYIKIMMIKVYPGGVGALKEGAIDLMKDQAGKAAALASKEGKKEFLRERQGFCDMDVDDALITGVASYEKTVFDFEISFWVVVALLGNVKGTAELGLKFGYESEIGDNIGPAIESRSEKIQQACKGAKLVYGVPFAKAIATGQIALDLFLLKAGVGIDVTILEAKLPATYEHFGGGNGYAGGVVFQFNPCGGSIYGFASVVSGIDFWSLRRTWTELARIPIYEWASPRPYKSGSITPGTLRDDASSDIPQESMEAGSTGPPEYVVLSHWRLKTQSPTLAPTKLAESKSCVSSPEIQAAPEPTWDRNSLFIGNFRDDSSRDLNCKSMVTTNPEVCVRYCKQHGFMYAAMQAKVHCFCDNEYSHDGRYYALSPGSSHYSHHGWACGAGWVNSVYRTVSTPAPSQAPTILESEELKYCTGDTNGIVCDKAAIGESEVFKMIPVDGGKYVLKNSLGKFCEDNGAKILCNANAIKSQSTFMKEELGNDVVALRSGRDAWINYCSYGAMGVSCHAKQIGAPERFLLTLEPAKTPKGSQFRFAGSSELVTLNRCDANSDCNHPDDTVYEYFHLADAGTESGTKRAFRNHHTKMFCPLLMLRVPPAAPTWHPPGYFTCGSSPEIQAAPEPTWDRNSLFIGNFRDDSSRDLNCKSMVTTNPEVCVRYCKQHGFMYAAMQAKIHCFCDNEYSHDSRYYALSPGSSHYSHHGWACGAGWVNSVYRTMGQEPDPWTQSPTPAPTQPEKLVCDEASITKEVILEVNEKGNDVIAINKYPTQFAMKLVDSVGGFRSSGPPQKITLRGQRDRHLGFMRYCNDTPDGIRCGSETIDNSTYFNRFPVAHDNTTDAFVIQAVHSQKFCVYQAEQGKIVCDQDGYVRPAGVFVMHDMDHNQYVIRNEYVKLYCEDDDQAPISCYRDTVGLEEKFILDFVLDH